MPITPPVVSVRTPPSARSPAPGQSNDNSHNGADPYAHLSPEQLTAMREELREAEIKFAERFRQANLISDEAEKKSRLDALGNSFSTKQSLIRKKYGVRLRMRRTKTEIIAERDRMSYKTAAELQADLGLGHKGGPGRPMSANYRPTTDTGSRPSSRGGSGADGHADRIGRESGWAAVNGLATASSTLASSISAPRSKVEALDEAGVHSSIKRRISGGEELPQAKRTAYAEMGGLRNAADVEPEMMDPTIDSETAHGNAKREAATAEEPIALDDSDSEGGDSSDEDIPSQLPPSVRQSLQRPSSAVASGGESRPGSSSI